MAIYNELLYNNLEGFLLACFPITRGILGERRWPRLVRAFFREARCHTPYFREIPGEFLAWLQAAERLPGPPWLAELAHYEWVELALDVMDADTPTCDANGDLLDGIPLLAPALMNLAYAWPVHRIGTNWRPRKPQATHLLVFRDRDDEIQFVELNPVSARLIALLRDGRQSGKSACLAVAREIGHSDPATVLAHGTVLLEELRTIGAIPGIRP
jgi:hypothetical protein